VYFIGIFLIIIVVRISFPEAISSKFKNNFSHFEFFVVLLFELRLLIKAFALVVLLVVSDLAVLFILLLFLVSLSLLLFFLFVFDEDFSSEDKLELGLGIGLFSKDDLFDDISLF